MLKIIESTSNNIVRLMPTSNAKLKVGLICQIVEDKGIPTCTVSDGTRPFGIISKINGPYGMASIWFDSMIVRTDKYEKQAGKYTSGSPLYVSKKGKFTVQKPQESSILVGYVVSGPTFDQKYIELNWV